MKKIFYIIVFLSSTHALAEKAPSQKTAVTISIHQDVNTTCDTISKQLKELNMELSTFNIDKQIRILRCQKKVGFLKTSFSLEVTWSEGFNHCDGSSVGSDFYKFLQINDNSHVKKIILSNLGFSPIEIKNYSYNYMISLCQLYLDE